MNNSKTSLLHRLMCKFVFIFSASWMFSLTLCGSYKNKRDQNENKKGKARNRQLIHKNYGKETELTETSLHLDMNMTKCPTYIHTGSECLKQTQKLYKL